MSQSSEESQGPEEVTGHPAWQEILDQLPDDLHPLIKPTLEKWETGVQQKLQDVRSQYDPYKPLVENKIPLDMVEQALYLHQQLENNPQELIAKAIQHYNLDYVPKDQIQTPVPEELEELEFDGVDITKHPAFQQLSKQLEQMNSTLTAQQQAEKEAAEQEELDNYLNQLEEDKGPFNKLMVATLIANGMDGEQAVETYKAEIAQAVQAALGTQQQTQQPPVVMGGDGTSGSGVPNQTVNMGQLSKDDILKLSLEFLENNDTNKA